MDEYPDLTVVSLSRSQAQVFEQLSDKDFWRYATEAAKNAHSLQYQADEYLVCKVGIRYCMVPVAVLGEVVPSPHQHTLLPAVPHWMLGLTTWRGEIIAEIDLEAYLWSDVESAQVQRLPADLLLIVQTQGVTLGLMVHAVNTMVHFDAEHIVPFELAPDWCSGLRPEVIKGILDEVLVLNIHAIFDDIVRKIKEQPFS